MKTTLTFRFFSLIEGEKIKSFLFQEGSTVDWNVIHSPFCTFKEIVEDLILNLNLDIEEYIILLGSNYLVDENVAIGQASGDRIYSLISTDSL